MEGFFKAIKRKGYNFLWLVTVFRRKRYLKQLRNRLKNTSPTIITSECIGGIIYHDLNLKFMSPTINMRFKEDEYILFLENLKGFLSCLPKEIENKEYDNPFGEVEYNGLKVTLDFVHYKTFPEALSKWEERKKRVDFDNIFIIWQVPNENGPSQDLLDRFLKLDFKNKVLLTGEKCPVKSKEVFKMRKIYRNPPYNPILSYKHELLSNKRYLNDFDYVEFLNSGRIRRG